MASPTTTQPTQALNGFRDYETLRPYITCILALCDICSLGADSPRFTAFNRNTFKLKSFEWNQ